MAIKAFTPAPVKDSVDDKNGVRQSWVSWFQLIYVILKYFYVGSGSPAGSVNAPKGSVYLNISGGTGTTLYVNETGGTSGWVGK